ncbi:hypothetical protein EHP00_2359 [Ecytonucleospora hepatopenaei]|uniref:Uncharacterized protein n=1 Tax=Ecytonucleospora hepatopenaei TaxID=646526 RepID=A0A1W0E7S0_9MICR|nr:hypothetical protein EHP00_2359 [Ecytonucleospora hepatopenaei]
MIYMVENSRRIIKVIGKILLHNKQYNTYMIYEWILNRLEDNTNNNSILYNNILNTNNILN